MHTGGGGEAGELDERECITQVILPTFQDVTVLQRHGGFQCNLAVVAHITTLQKIGQYHTLYACKASKSPLTIMNPDYRARVNREGKKKINLLHLSLLPFIFIFYFIFSPIHSEMNAHPRASGGTDCELKTWQRRK